MATESQLLAELQRLWDDNVAEDPDGFLTTREMARVVSDREGITHDNAVRRVRRLLDIAFEQDRLEVRHVQRKRIARVQTVPAYRLKSA